MSCAAVRYSGLSGGGTGFERRTRSGVEDLRRAVETRNATLSERSIEVLRSAAITLDRDELLRVTLELEEAVERHDFEGLQAALDGVPELLERCFREFEG